MATSQRHHWGKYQDRARVWGESLKGPTGDAITASQARAGARGRGWAVYVPSADIIRRHRGNVARVWVIDLATWKVRATARTVVKAVARACAEQQRRVVPRRAMPVAVAREWWASGKRPTHPEAERLWAKLLEADPAELGPLLRKTG